jgi:maltose O-acetyltransferase
MPLGAGVTIGDDTTIGTGSIVLDDVPPRVLAAGNPCCVVRPL